jgi:hypothetical protein
MRATQAIHSIFYRRKAKDAAANRVRAAFAERGERRATPPLLLLLLLLLLLEVVTGAV